MREEDRREAARVTEAVRQWEFDGLRGSERSGAQGTEDAGRALREINAILEYLRDGMKAR